MADRDLTFEAANTFFYLKPGTDVKIEEPVFPRLKEKKQKKTDAKKVAAAEGLIDISDFAKVNLTVAEITEAEKVDGADKLLKLQVNTGSESRQLVAGIAEYYQPGDIIGKKIVIVANLQPANIRGIDSNGMLLAAKKGKK